MSDSPEKVFKLLFPVRESHYFCLSMHFMYVNLKVGSMSMSFLFKA